MNWQTFFETLSSACVGIAFKLLGALIVFVVGRWLIKLLMKHFPNGTKKHPFDPTARSDMYPVFWTPTFKLNN